MDSIRIWLFSIERKANSILNRLRTLQRTIAGLSGHKPKQAKHKSSPISTDHPLIIPTPETGAVSIQLQQVFDHIDSNRDGKISPLELSGVLSGLTGCNEAIALHKANGMIKVMDRDGDGLVDFDEFTGALDTSEEEDCLEDAFSIYDTNGDGRISSEELRRVLKGLQLGKYSIKDCRSMIERFDRDGDGFVDFDEFRRMMTR